jgi:hypothetical protein
VGVLERRWLILLALLVLGLASCRPVEPDLELTAHEAPVNSPLATRSATSSPLQVPPSVASPLQTPAAVLRSPIQPSISVTRATGMEPTAPAPQREAVPLVIMHTNDTWGYYDPCG